LIREFGAGPLSKELRGRDLVRGLRVGTKRFTFPYRQQRSLEDERSAREQADLMPSDDGKAGTINIMIVESDGTERFTDVAIPTGRLVALGNERMGEEAHRAGGRRATPANYDAGRTPSQLVAVGHVT